MLRNTSESWGLVSRLFHWVLAAWIIGQFAFGLWMGEVPPKEERIYYYTLHASSGVSLLTLMVLRILWRSGNPVPELPAGLPAWEPAAAWFGHMALYAVIFAALIAGLVLAGSFNPPLDVRLFGLIPVTLPGVTSEETKDLLEETHEVLAFTVIVLVIGHSMIALWHHYVRRNNVLTRMFSG